MNSIILHAIMSIVSTIVSAYLQIKGIGGGEVVAAVGAVAAGNAGAAVNGVVKMRQEKKDAQAFQDELAKQVTRM
jgi:hypothetical protein